MLLYRRKSCSISPRHHKSRSPTARHLKSRSPTPKRYKRQRSRSSSLSPTHKSSSPSLGSIVHKNASEKLKKEEEERKRYIKYSHLYADSFIFLFTVILDLLELYPVYFLIFATFSKFIEFIDIYHNHIDLWSHDALDLVEADILLDSFCYNNMIFGSLG